jgi:3',5'-cyclic AMP phosphodiesterase CpdA
MKTKRFFVGKTFSLAVLMAWLFVTGCATSKMSNQPFFFIQMSDPQFGMFTANKSFQQETRNFEKAISEANRLKPAFVIVTGDLVNRNGDAAQIAEYKRVTAQLSPSIPLYNVAGNHDVGNTPFPADITSYRNLFGKDYYAFNYRSMLGIVLNSVYLHSPQNVPEQAKEQEQWLIKTLAEAKKKKYQHIFIFMHHPMFLKQENEPDEYFNIPVATRNKYLNLFKANNIHYIFAGHYHRNAFAKNTDFEMVTTGPVGMPLGKDSSGFRIITVNGSQVHHRYHSLDSIAARK